LPSMVLLEPHQHSVAFQVQAVAAALQAHQMEPMADQAAEVILALLAPETLPPYRHRKATTEPSDLILQALLVAVVAVVVHRRLALLRYLTYLAATAATEHQAISAEAQLITQAVAAVDTEQTRLR
jgi:hypothetical protein